MIVPCNPMLAETVTDEHLEMLLTTGRPHKNPKRHIDRQPYLFGSTKLDGIRGLKGDVMYSRNLKPIRRTAIQAACAALPVGCDSEFIVGDPTHPDVFQISTSGVMSSVPEDPDIANLPITCHLFDCWGTADRPFEERNQWVQRVAGRFQATAGIDLVVRAVPQVKLYTLADILAYENELLEQGYEGVMIRTPSSTYKAGRSTLTENYLLRIKRFEDSEAVILDVLEEKENTNEAKRDERGFAKRSTAKAGKVPKGVAGSFRVRDIKHGWEFNCPGFTDAQAIDFWARKAEMPGRIVKYKFFRPGMKDVPRFPGFKGFRDPDDM